MAEMTAAEEAAAAVAPEPEPIVVEAPEEGSDPGIPARREAQTAEAQAEEAALAFLKAQRTGKPEESPKAPEPVKAEAPPPEEPPKAAEPAPDSKADELLRRLTAVETRARAAEQRAKDLEARASRADKWEAAAEAAKNGDASKVFDQLEWTVDTVTKYLEGGKEALQPTVVEKRVAGVADEIAQLKAELARRDAQNVVESYKSTVIKDLPGLKEVAPTFLAFHTDPDTGVLDPHAAAEAVWNFQVAMYNRKGPDGSPDPLELSHEEAAKALNAGLEKTKKRLAGPLAKVEAAKPVAVVAGTVPPKQEVAAKKTLARDSREDPDEADALAVLASLRKQRQLGA